MAYKKISGVYIIQNNVNSKVYVGCSINISKRINKHKENLKKGKHSNVYLQNAWNKYGENAFSFFIWDICEEEYIFSFEHYWTILLDSTNKVNGYNIQPTDPNKSFIRHSKETIEKIRNTKLSQSTKITKIITKDEKLKINENKKRKQSATMKKLGIKPPPQKPIKIYCYNLQGVFIKEYISIKDAATSLKIDRSALSKCIRNKGGFKSLGGFMWKIYKNEQGINKYNAKTRKNI